MITSAANAKIKHLKELRDKPKARAKEGLFIAEGIKLFMEAPDNLIKEVYLRNGVIPKLEESYKEAPLKLKRLKDSGIFIEEISEELFNRVSDTESPQGIIIVCDMPSYTLSDITESAGKNVLVLEDIKDPGNLGTIVRTAEGAGVRGIIMTKGTVDILSPKVIRSSMGSIFRVPFIYTEDILKDTDTLKERGFLLTAADIKGKILYNELKSTHDKAILIGNEARGLSDELLGKSDTLVIIPMRGKLESLNAAVAAAILMYEYKEF